MNQQHWNNAQHRVNQPFCELTEQLFYTVKSATNEFNLRLEFLFAQTFILIYQGKDITRIKKVNNTTSVSGYSP
ncbi:hypothetical Protein YC6258_04106 [Gynuella sunshinyii YC6258]|uniref:Uncharacterized protein n=1 Tax=Gynuella sunshinyii YC6258 TaxID=1445510 RepID=A0A0C5VN43_9GAMM|nr:hypothetical Protein YC6258_04106 [Gynuella sunshinyii YC6258]